MIFNTLFDKIFVLSLKSSTERRSHIENEFKRVGISKYDFYDAISPDSDEYTTFINSGIVSTFPPCFRCGHMRCACENNFLTSFQLANWASFLSIFNTIIEKNYKFVLLFEDYIVFTTQYKRIFNRLFSKANFRKYRINMNKPLLIKMGAAFDAVNHNSIAEPRFIKNFALCNPCFAINIEMAKIYINSLKKISWTSDTYFHKIIPQHLPSIQSFTTYPYGIYELSFVRSKQKFESLIRPKNQLRRIEYKEYFFITTNFMQIFFLKKLFKNGLGIDTFNMGLNGCINYFMLLDDTTVDKYYFQKKYFIFDNPIDDIKLIYHTIINKIDIFIKMYEAFLVKINKQYNINISFTSETSSLLESVIYYYYYYLELTKMYTSSSSFIKIDMRTLSSSPITDFFNKNGDMNRYLEFKKKILESYSDLDEEINKYIIFFDESEEIHLLYDATL